MSSFILFLYFVISAKKDTPRYVYRLDIALLYLSIIQYNQYNYISFQFVINTTFGSRYVYQFVTGNQTYDLSIAIAQYFTTWH